MSQKIRHRGPDWSGIYCGSHAILCHERLSIVDPQSGKQPLYSPDSKQVLAVNGEIYNHQQIRQETASEYEYQTGSDCEVILALYRAHGINFLERLSGIFAFALYDTKEDRYLVGRDPIGVIPLYQGWDADGHYYVASELKALEGFCCMVQEFQPGHCLASGDDAPKRWYRRDWFEYPAVKDNKSSIPELRSALEAAVKRQMMSDVPYGVLLSGGEKVRCMISKMMLSGANFLVFDQPTNHLDLESIAALNNGMEAFRHNIIFSSHDHQLTQTVANRIIEITDDGIIDRMCSFDEYMDLTGMEQNIR